MPKFSVTIRQTLSVYGDIDVTAKDEDTATEKAQEIIDSQALGELSVTVEGATKKYAAIEWEAPEPVEVEIEEVTEY
jgi:hypothetical protein